MDDSSLLEILTMAFGGIGVFLLGMRLLSNGLQTLAGERLNRWTPPSRTTASSRSSPASASRR
jgi:hypothetical protein